ncbi:MAG: bifunctional tetrahydrofolate synthase/dihydrofolate synthase [Rhodanobacteraceae bacterium]
MDYQQRIHARRIDLGLERVREVWRRMGASRIARTVITVGGTNGKGSTVAFLEAMLHAGGKRVGAYTSPHILRYNERVRIDGVDSDDGTLIAAFKRSEAARGANSADAIPLTYFEFGTLAAFDVFSQADLDVALLEVGLGGRLDAVNIIDADAAIVTTVDLDHMEYLGNDRMSIGREKAGIFRGGKPAIIGEIDPPRSLLEEAQRIGARIFRNGIDYETRIENNRWYWCCGTEELRLPLPILRAPAQIANAAAAIAALHSLRDSLDWNPEAIARGLRDARVAGRLQQIGDAPPVIVDVAHNVQAARELARWLDVNSVAGENHAIFGALADKDIAGIVRALCPYISHWHLAGLETASPRGLPVDELARRVREAVPDAAISEHSNVAAALLAASAQAGQDDRILAFGSFFVVAAVMRQRDPLG